MRPPVSIVMAARDEAAMLPGALASALAQDYAGEIEVVVADGSAGPETAAAVRARFPPGRFPRLRLLPNPGRSAAAGLNRAAAAARHAILVRCDARCRLPPGYVGIAVDTLLRTGACAVGGLQRAGGTTAFTRAVALAMTTPLGAGDARYRIGGPEGPADTVWLGVYRRGALEAAGGFDETLLRNQDYALNWRLRERGGTVWFTPALQAEYRPRATFGALARQYWAWGRWKRAMLGRHPGSLRWRQLAAPALTGALAVSCLAAPLAGPVAGALPLAYLGALALGAVACGLRRRSAAAVLLPAVLATMHLAWGAGFWAACLRPPAAEAARPLPVEDPSGGARMRARAGRLAATGTATAAAADGAAASPREGYKRPFDLALLGLLGLVLSPVWLALGLGIALAIRLEDGGPVFYRQTRLGRDGRRFSILKFRTMRADAEAATGPVWAERADRRATRVGRVLRRRCLDELPQALNVLRGEMSLVGPRPERPELAQRIEREVPGFSARLRVRPGVAGLAQAEGAGWRSPRRKLDRDLAYIAAMGPRLDLVLIARCIARALRPRTVRSAASGAGRAPRVGP